MRKFLLTTLLTTLAVGLCSTDASAFPQFMKGVKEKYEFKSVSCNTCHSTKDEIAEEDMAAFKANAKHFRNDFGKLFLPGLKGKNVEKRAEESSDLKSQARDAASEAEEEQLKAKADVIDEGLTKDFLEVLEKVEAMKAADGKSYGEKLKAGEIEGTKFPE